MDLKTITETTVKILTTSTLTGAAVWLGRGVVQLNFRDGFLFSALFPIFLKIAHKVNPEVEKRFQAPIIHTTVFCSIAIGVPLAIIHQITPLNLMRASYLTIVAIAVRLIFQSATGEDPSL